MTTHDSQVPQSQGNNAFTVHHPSTSFSELPNLQGTDVSAGPIDPEDQLPGFEFEGTCFHFYFT